MSKVLEPLFLRIEWKIIQLYQKLAKHSLRLGGGFMNKVLLEKSCSHRDEYLKQVLYEHKFQTDTSWTFGI